MTVTTDDDGGCDVYNTVNECVGDGGVYAISVSG